jgi:hypothetical protein
VRAFLRRNAVPLGIGLGSRIFSVVLLVVMGLLSNRGWPQLTDATNGFAAWDGQWFLAIAANGYHPQALVSIGDGGYHDFAFFPLWPLLIRIGSFGVLPLDVVAVVLANAFFVAAMVPSYRLLQRLTGDDASAARGLVLLAIGPAAYVWSMAYSESLFLLLVAWALLGASSRFMRPILATFAQLTRLTGSALSLAALATSLRERRLTAVAMATIVAGPLTLLAWVAFVWWLTGDPAGYLRGSPSWYSLSDTSAGLASVVDGLLNPSPYLLISLITIIALTIAAVRCLAIDLESGTYAIASVAATVLLAHWVNMPRHALVALPAYAILGRWMPPGFAGRLVIALAMAGQVILANGSVRWASFPP